MDRVVPLVMEGAVDSLECAELNVWAIAVNELNVQKLMDRYGILCDYVCPFLRKENIGGAVISRVKERMFHSFAPEKLDNWLENRDSSICGKEDFLSLLEADKIHVYSVSQPALAHFSIGPVLLYGGALLRSGGYTYRLAVVDSNVDLTEGEVHSGNAMNYAGSLIEFRSRTRICFITRIAWDGKELIADDYLAVVRGLQNGKIRCIHSSSQTSDSLDEIASHSSWVGFLPSYFLDVPTRVNQVTSVGLFTNSGRYAC